MNIGILTFHRAINYGAFLQSFCLQSYLKKHYPDCNVEIIDYIPNAEYKKIYRNILGTLKRKGISECCKEIRKVSVFKKSLAFQNLSEFYLHKDNFNKLYHHINSNYDLVIVGSDAVLNWCQNGFPSAFYLDYDFSVPIVMYAASAHGLKYLEINEEQKKYCKRCFSRFSILGVRDENTVNFINAYAPELNTIHTCDPTFLIDKKHALDLAGDVDGYLKKKYKFDISTHYIVTMVNNIEIQRTIRNLFHEQYKIITLFKPNKYADVFMYDLNPFQWISVLANADLVITQYFHGALLSMRYGTSTMVIDATKPDLNYISKLYDVTVNRLGFEDRYSRECDILDGNTSFWDTAKRIATLDESKFINSRMDKEAETCDYFFNLLDSIIS